MHEEATASITSSRGDVHLSERSLKPEEVDGFFKGVIGRMKEEDAQTNTAGFGGIDRVHIFHQTTATISFKDVSFSIKTRKKHTQAQVDKVILAPLSGVIRPGTLVALMGPSGCGKSTLLDILADRKTSEWSGAVFLNGRPIDKLYDLITAYVPQSEVMPQHWRVEEAVTFSFLLRRPLPRIIGKRNVSQLVDLFLESLGLDEVKQSFIGGPAVRGISGGQRRRVALARGLASGAHVIFCDEPTSGLSSTDAENVVKRLKLMSIRLGTSFVVVIHQPKPDVAALFDHLILLTAGPGRCCYNGPMKAAFDHYAAVGYPVPVFANPADYFLDLVSPGCTGEKSAEFVDFYQNQCAATVAMAVEVEVAEAGMTSTYVLQCKFLSLEAVFGKLDVPKGDSKYLAPMGRQFKLVFQRTVVLKLRSKEELVAQGAAAVVKGVILGVAFLNINKQVPMAQVAFIFLLAQMEVIGLLQGIESSISGRGIMKEEVCDRLYRDEVFILSVAVVDLCTFLVFNIIYLSIAFSLSGLSWEYFGSFYSWSLLCLLAIQSYFQMCAAVGKNTSDATAKALPLMILFLLFNGYFVTKETAVSWMVWAIYLSPLFYFIQQVAVELFEDGTEKSDPDYLDSGQYVVDYYNFKDMAGVAVAALVGEIAAFRILQVFFLKTMNNIDR